VRVAVSGLVTFYKETSGEWGLTSILWSMFALTEGRRWDMRFHLSCLVLGKERECRPKGGRAGTN
jgi:hypothetical protein